MSRKIGTDAARYWVIGELWSTYCHDWLPVVIDSRQSKATAHRLAKAMRGNTPHQNIRVVDSQCAMSRYTVSRRPA